MTNTIPNFDAMSREDLLCFLASYSRASRKKAEELVGDRRVGYTNIVSTLANYALNKAVAMRARLEGDIKAAEVYEHACDLCYDRLPADLKW